MKTPYKYRLKERLLNLSVANYKKAREELPTITGYSWKCIRYNWSDILHKEKRSIPFEPMEKIAKWLGCSIYELKNEMEGTDGRDAQSVQINDKSMEKSTG